MFRQTLVRSTIRRLASMTAATACLLAPPAFAKDIHIAFIEDGIGATEPALSTLVAQELQPLLNSGDRLVPVVFGTGNAQPQVMQSFAQANADPDVDFIVVAGFIASQEIYQVDRFAKPSYLLRVLDPNLSGLPVRDKTKNLRSYSVANEIADVHQRLKDLFDAEHVGIILPDVGFKPPSSIGGAVATAAKNSGIESQFISLDFGADLSSQLNDLDAVILPPVALPAKDNKALLQALQRNKIPSFAAGGDGQVLAGALISDTLDEDVNVLARRVALDLQLAIAGESKTQGFRVLEPKKRTTINVDTARALGVDFNLNEMIGARIVQGNTDTLKLNLLSSLEQARDRNLGLRGQLQQLRIDEESLEQARAARRPQLAAQVEYTRRGEALPEQDTLAALSLSQTLYSPSENAAVDVAKIGLESSHKALEQVQIDTIQQTATAYFEALQTQSLFESTLRDLTLNRENLGFAEQRKNSGSGSGADIYRWQAVIASSESALLSAYTANTRAQGQLAQLLNTHMQIPTTLDDVDLDQPPFDLLHEGIQPYLNSTGQANLLKEASTVRTLENSPQIDIAAANASISNTNLKALKRAYYTPELSMSASYGLYLDSSENAGGVELDGEDDWSLAVTAQLPIWLGGTRSSLIKQYQAQTALADTQLQSTRLALWADSGNAVNDLVSNFKAIAISERAEAAALRSQEITQQSYKLGSSSVTDLLDTQNSYREAQDNANNARYQYLTALVNFQALMGEMPMLKPGAEQQQWLQAFTQSMLDVRAQQ